MRPSISFDNLTGTPSVSFAFTEEEQQRATIGQLFAFLDRQNFKVYIAIDQFQQILEYPEKNTDAMLRTYIQKLKNTHFIFCGSHQKMMHELFNSAKRPFFASCSNLYLSTIKKSDYSKFIVKVFAKYGVKIEKIATKFIYNWTLGHTFYTQYLCNQLFATGKKQIDEVFVKLKAAEILTIHEGVFYQYRSMLSGTQWKVLIAVSKEQELYHPNASKFLKQYNLGSASTVNRAIESLIDKELIFENAFADKPYYQTYNKFLMRWGR